MCLRVARWCLASIRLFLPVFVVMVSASLGCGDNLKCGPGTVPRGHTCIVDDGLLTPLVESVTVSSQEVDLASAALYSYGELTVRGSLAVVAEDFSTDVGIGLHSDDAETGCVIGAFSLDHTPVADDPAEPVDHAFEELVRLTGDCEVLVGEDDITVFLAFDPYRLTNLVGRPDENTPPPAGEKADPPDADGTDATVYELARGSVVEPSASCTGCDEQFELLASPGKDVVLFDLELSSSVGVLEVPSAEVPAQTAAEIIAENIALGLPEPPGGDVADAPAAVALTSGEPTFSLTASFRTLGVDVDEEVLGSTITYRADIRPLPGGVNYQTVPSNELDWLVLSTDPDTDGAVADPDEVQDHTGADEPSLAASYYIVGSVFDRMTEGSWKAIDEFELRFCLVASFQEAVYPGDSGPRDNNCLQGPVVVIREVVTPAGPELGAPENAAAAGAWERQKSWTRLWGDRGKASAELAFWLTLGFTTNTGTTNFGLGGSSMSGQGGWYETGARTTSCVFGACADLARAVFTARDYQSASDTFSMEGRILIFDFLPRITIAWPDGTLTLAQILSLASNASGKEYSVVKSFEKSIIGKKFTIPVVNKSIEAAVKAFVDMGLDDGATSIKKEALGPAPGPCDGKEIVDGQCFALASRQWVNLPELDQACRDDFGFDSWPAILRTEADHLAATAVPTGPYSFLMGHVYDIKSTVNPGLNTVRPWRTPPDFFVSSLYTIGLDTVGLGPPASWPAIGTKLQIENASEATYPYLMSGRLEQGMCSLRAHGATVGGSKATATVAPFVAAGIRATVKANFRSLTVFAEGSVSIINTTIEFVGVLADRFTASEKVFLELERQIDLVLSVLSGSIDIGATLRFRAPCVPKFWKICNYRATGRKNILSWKGFSWTTPILPVEKITYGL